MERDVVAGLSGHGKMGAEGKDSTAGWESTAKNQAGHNKRFWASQKGSDHPPIWRNRQHPYVPNNTNLYFQKMGREE